MEVTFDAFFADDEIGTAPTNEGRAAEIFVRRQTNDFRNHDAVRARPALRHAQISEIAAQRGRKVAQIREECLVMIAPQRGQITQIIIAHRLGTIEHADRIIYLDRGEKIAEGTKDELLKTCEPFRHMWDMLHHSEKKPTPIEV